MTSTRAVGIDLGTTYSAVAYLDERGRTVMMRNAGGDILTPSVVFFCDNETVVGREAKKYLAMWPDAVAECVKRDMGEPLYSKPIRGQKMPPEVIQACVLRELKQDAAAALGENFKAVITVPAYFDEKRRRATAHAGEMAGIDVLDIVNEPTAAALSFGETLGYLTPTGEPRRPLKVLVYDLGGGTFDVTIIDIAPGNITTLATDGDVRLGGRDWDEALLNFVAEQFVGEAAADPRQDAVALGELWISVEEAKRTLSVRGKTMVPVRHAGQLKDIPVTVEQFEELTEPLLERTSHTTRQVLAAAGLGWNEIDRLLLVGGSTRMPMVVRMLEQLSGKKPDQSVHPDEAVARGAAIFAGYLLARLPSERREVLATSVEFTEVEDERHEPMPTNDKLSPGRSSGATSAARVAAGELDKIFAAHATRPGLANSKIASMAQPAQPQGLDSASPPGRLSAGDMECGPSFTVTDVNSHSLGIEGINRKTDRKENVVLIPRNSPLPARSVQHFVTNEACQRSVVVQVLEGDNPDPQACYRIGRAVMRDLPEDLPRGWPVEVVYEYGTNGRLAVYARVPRTESKITIELEHDEGLSSAQVRRWRRVIESNPGFDTFEAVLEEILNENDRVCPTTCADTSDGKASSFSTVAGTLQLPSDGSECAHADFATTVLDEDFDRSETNEAHAHPGASTTPKPRRPKKRNWAITVTGHVVAPLVGLLIGYYVLALLTPRGNFLNLPLPGLEVLDEQNGAVGLDK